MKVHFILTAHKLNTPAQSLIHRKILLLSPFSIKRTNSQMKNCTLGKHISKINTEEISQMVKEISQEKVKKIHFCNHFSLSTKFTNKKLHSRKACIKTNLEEEISQMVKMSHYSARWRKSHKKKWRRSTSITISL